MKVEILPSRGSLDNLQHLADPTVQVDVGFVQGGLTEGVDISRLVSLGTVFTQPLMVYYRGAEPVELLTQLRGKRIAIGAEGSGTRALALTLLKANEMDGPPTSLLDSGRRGGGARAHRRAVDAAFLMGDSATPKVMRSLREAPGVELMSFRQAEGYLRRLKFLSQADAARGGHGPRQELPAADRCS